MLQQIFSLSFMTAFLAAAVRLAVPLMYGGIGETIAEKSGILNIGMEGVMLSGAFFSFAGAWYSGNLFVGLLCGMAGGLIVSLLHGLLSITLIQNQSVSGLAINMLMLGVTSFLFKLMSNGQGYQHQTLPLLSALITFLTAISRLIPCTPEPGFLQKTNCLLWQMENPQASR